MCWTFVALSIVFVLEAVQSLNPCQDCPLRNGLYKAKHPSKCCRYYDCMKIDDTTWSSVERKCGNGLFWNDAQLTCNVPGAANCATDFCSGSANGDKVPDGCTCYGYFTCADGVSTNWAQCPDNTAFDAVTDTCVSDATCTQPQSNPVTICTDRTMAPHPTDPTKYIWTAHGQPHEMSCAPGSWFNPNMCLCDNGVSSSCSPETDIDFSKQEWSFTGVTLQQEDGRDVGFFDGLNSKITLPAFSNMGSVDTFMVSLTFKETFTDTANNYVLFSNCDCASTDACSIRSYINRHSGNSNDILAQVDTTTANRHTLTNTVLNRAGEWKTHTYVFYKGHFANAVDSVHESKFLGEGKIENRQASLHIGYDGCGNELKNFVGYIDQLTIYRCVPSPP